MIYKRGKRYTLRSGAVRQLVANQLGLGMEHDKLREQGFGLPRITVAVATSGFAQIRATWSKKIPNGRVSHRLIIRGVQLA
jgi:hypothetical protein